MMAVRTEPQRGRLVARGADVAAAHDWQHTARAHLAAYEQLTEPAHA